MEVFIFFVETLALGSKYTCKKLYEMFLNERITSYGIRHFLSENLTEIIITILRNALLGMIRTIEDLIEVFSQVIAKIEQ